MSYMLLAVFYFFAGLMLVFALFATLLSNNVKKVLCLIGTFFCAAILTIILRAEFVATLLVLVYMGAIAMLFLFIVMMVGGENAPKTRRNSEWSMAIILVMAFFATIMMLFLTDSQTKPVASTEMSILQIGEKIYHELWMDLLYVGFILLAGLIGAILLTIRYKSSRISVKQAQTNIHLEYPSIRSGVKI